MEHSTGLVQVVIFEAADRNNIGGSAYGGQRSICCTPDLAKLEGCKQGEVIRIPSATDIKWPIVLNVQFSGNYLSTNIRDEYVNVTKTGMYNLFFITCDPKLKGLIMSGKTVWKNPDGYLPGRMAPLMKFYVLMSLAYLLLSVIWFTQYMRFWKDILQLQHCITAVIALGLFEMILWYSEYANFNSTGTRPVAITTWVVTVGAIRKTLARLLMLSISMVMVLCGPPSVAKRSSVKLDIYRKFSNALAVAVIASVAWIAYEFVINLICFLIGLLQATDPFNERWYAYSEEVGEESDDEEAHSLTRGKTDGDISLVEKKEKNAGTTDVYDETEEDKRNDYL
ncbi:hypothetical protein GH714_004460 [Hevea brasiliensis]|uniref:GOST seven transmembrane domain-containing protein n=1 Tax=Hevea brasiliensis TaxID=3981 RepID=A0A6A6KYW4_HEVBR|nr:hypothetical protein GH714_004460 [Hevea brasiliensis]